ncbi:MAG TPA: FeoA family protein [Ruminococcus sp.]|mgnify:CR=1 FL=1
MKNITTLSSLREGQRCRVKSLMIEGAMRSRLGELGLIEGAQVECVHRSASGDPAAYCICGALIALRNSDSSGVIVYT